MGPAMGLLYKYFGENGFAVVGIIALLLLFANYFHSYITAENEIVKGQSALKSLLCIIGVIIFILFILF
jgi:hypothetical protein